MFLFACSSFVILATICFTRRQRRGHFLPGSSKHWHLRLCRILLHDVISLSLSLKLSDSLNFEVREFIPERIRTQFGLGVEFLYLSNMPD